jgi:hypothetical protein
MTERRWSQERNHSLLIFSWSKRPKKTLIYYSHDTEPVTMHQKSSYWEWRDVCPSSGIWGHLWDLNVSSICNTTQLATWDFYLSSRSTLFLSPLNILSPFPGLFPLISAPLHCGVYLGAEIQSVSLFCKYTLYLLSSAYHLSVVYLL